MAAEDRLNSDASLPDSCTIEQANPVDVPVQMWNSIGLDRLGIAAHPYVEVEGHCGPVSGIFSQSVT